MFSHEFKDCHFRYLFAQRLSPSNTESLTAPQSTKGHRVFPSSQVCHHVIMKPSSFMMNILLLCHHVVMSSCHHHLSSCSSQLYHHLLRSVVLPSFSDGIDENWWTAFSSQSFHHSSSSSWWWFIEWSNTLIQQRIDQRGFNTFCFFLIENISWTMIH